MAILASVATTTLPLSQCLAQALTPSPAALSLAPPLPSLLSSAASLPAPPSVHVDLQALRSGVVDAISPHSHVGAMQLDVFHMSGIAGDISRVTGMSGVGDVSGLAIMSDITAGIAGTLMWLQPFTQSEIAGLVFGAGIIACAVSAPRVDQWFARAQRRNLGLCEECGGVRFLPCNKCSKQASPFRLEVLSKTSDDTQTKACSCCGGKGRVVCHVCVK